MHSSSSYQLQLRATLAALREVEQIAEYERGLLSDPPAVREYGKVPSLKDLVATIMSGLAQHELYSEANGLKAELDRFEFAKGNLVFCCAFGGLPAAEYEEKVAFYGPFPRLSDNFDEAEQRKMELAAGAESMLSQILHRTERLIRVLSEELGQSAGPQITDDAGPGASAGEVKLGKRFLLAWKSFQRAVDEHGVTLPDREAYDWLKNVDQLQDLEPGDLLYDYELPPFDSWARYLRKARNVLGQNKYSPRAGRDTGRSIVRPEQV